eukprot:3290288-Prymnesium_polylepis.1
MADRQTDVKYAATGTATVQLASLGSGHRPKGDRSGSRRISVLCQLIGGYDEHAAHAELGMNLLEFVLRQAQVRRPTCVRSTVARARWGVGTTRGIT